ncbi:uncharacterized protein [Primulina huaijiensis]|uniref:uncharacterized protein n=1 Tax=Primulina huaijiensis TaxID=1492673 RepID=UPI003CC73B8E
MKFLIEVVRFAMDKLGKDASIGQLMNFIFAARMARKHEKVARVSVSGDEDSNKVVKHLCKSLLIQFLVLNLLAVAQIQTSGFGRYLSNNSFDSITVKTEEWHPDAVAQVGISDFLEN